MGAKGIEDFLSVGYKTKRTEACTWRQYEQHVGNQGLNTLYGNSENSTKKNEEEKNERITKD